MNYKWTINLHDGYPLFHILPPKGHIPPSLHTLCNLKPTMFHLGDDYLCPHKFLLPPEDNGETLRARVTRNVVEVTEKADWERVEKFSYILGIGNGKLDKITPCNQLVDHLDAAVNEENEINDVLYKFRALIGYQGPLKATDLILKGCKYKILVAWETGEKIYEPLSVLETAAPVRFATYDGWKRYRNLAKRDKHDLSSLASSKGEVKSSFSSTSLFKSPTSSTLCFGEPTLGNLKQVKLLCSPTSCTSCHPTLAKLNQETELCITKYIPLCDSAVHTGTTSSVPSSPSETNRVSDCNSRLVTTPSSRRILDKPKIEVTKVLIHHVGKNGEHFYGENFIYEYPSKRHIKSKVDSTIDQASWKLTGEGNSESAIYMNVCPLRFIGEIMTQA